jgi:hypothetical protein
MKKNIFLLILVLNSIISFGQLEDNDTLLDKSKSSKYLFKAYIQRCPEGNSNCKEQCVINIYSKQSKKLFQVLSFEQDDEWEMSLKYGINYGDFNFDGIKDFSIAYTQGGMYCDGRRKFYIFDSMKNKFIYSKELTDTIMDYCEYDYDIKKKEIIGFVHQGCCYHGDDHFVWNGNKLIKIFERIQDDTIDSIFSLFTVKRFVNGKWKVTEYKKKRE